MFSIKNIRELTLKMCQTVIKNYLETKNEKVTVVEGKTDHATSLLNYSRINN